MTHTREASPGLDLSLCDREPIHIPGAIQPHGAFLAALADGNRVTHASANLVAILGQPAESALGRPLTEVIGEAAYHALWDAGPWEGSALGQIHTRPGSNGSLLHLRAHRSGPHICVDITAASTRVGQAPPVTMLQSVLDTFGRATNTVELCELAVRGMKAITGYDRIMAYRFAANGHGEVIAEVREAAIASYLGLHYPATDIPVQARRLVLRQRVGAIADTSYAAVPLLTDPALDESTPIDLTHSALRSVSPIHLEYLRNMNVAACLTVGLGLAPDPGGQHQDHRLWGMLVCQHETPREAGQELRAVVDMIGQVMSLLLHSLSEAEVYAQKAAQDATLRAFAARLAAPVPLPEALAAAEVELLSLVGASGALVSFHDTVFCLGRTPAPEAAERALAVLRHQADGKLLAVDDLSLSHPDLACCINDGSGALLLPLEQGDKILWFRPEQSRTVFWGGNPDEHVFSDPLTGRLSPRNSFGAWRQEVRGRSAPWSRVDLALARDVLRVIQAEVAQRARTDLIWLSRYDPLTKLPNRNLLELRLAEVRQETEGSLRQSAVLLFLDLDGSKAINDTLGYAAGDALLVEVARRLVAVAGQENLTARLGGDQFAVLCRGLDEHAVAALGDRIRRAVEAPFEIAGQACTVSAIVVIAVPDESGRLDLMQAADRAMYAAKVTIEARQNAEAQRQKMEALGRMMGGVAHEINNMLQPVALLVQDVVDRGMVAGEGREYLDIVVDCTRKARQIIGDLLAFSRPGTRSAEVHDPVALLQDGLRLVQQAIPANILLDIRTGGELPPVTVDRTAFVQVLLNLATNAVAAMAGQGKLSFSLDEVAGGSDGASFVRLRVADTGCGMTKATLDHAFEPFFTTKAVGQGTGLGLPVVYGLVKEMDGTIALASEPGRGTTVTILIPGQNGNTDNGIDIGD